MATTHCSFSQWLLTQWYRHDGVGHLAAVARTDAQYPADADYATTKQYILTTVQRALGHACPRPAHFLEQAHAEYLLVQDATRTVHIDACAILAECRRRGFTVLTVPTDDPDVVGVHVQGPGIVDGDAVRSRLAASAPGRPARLTSNPRKKKRAARPMAVTLATPHPTVLLHEIHTAPDPADEETL